MTENTEKPFEIGTSSNPDLAGSSEFGVNDARTCADSDTPVTQPRSVDVLAQTKSDLRAIRRQYGATSAIGHCCSNLDELLEKLPPGAEDRIDYLTPDGVLEQRARQIVTIQKENGRLARLLAAARQ